MCKALTPFRLTSNNGKVNKWYGNFSNECKKALVLEMGKLCYLLEIGKLETTSTTRVSARRKEKKF